MLRLVLGLAVVCALGYGVLKMMTARTAQPVTLPADVPGMKPLRANAQAGQQLEDELKRIEDQNRAAMERQLRGAGF